MTKKIKYKNPHSLNKQQAAAATGQLGMARVDRDTPMQGKTAKVKAEPVQGTKDKWPAAVGKPLTQ